MYALKFTDEPKGVHKVFYRHLFRIRVFGLFRTLTISVLFHDSPIWSCRVTALIRTPGSRTVCLESLRAIWGKKRTDSWTVRSDGFEVMNTIKIIIIECMRYTFIVSLNLIIYLRKVLMDEFIPTSKFYTLFQVSSLNVRTFKFHHTSEYIYGHKFNY